MSESKSPIKHLKAIAIGAGSGLLILVLIIGGFTLSAPAKPSATTPSVTPTETPATTPTEDARNCSVADLASDELLQGLQAQVINPATNEVLFDYLGDSPVRTASVMKLLTAAAAFRS
ncbi:MAG: hypothetical protein EBQ79_04410 [Actinobacteria bacterium]|nr:hypothetical protein [Actinomycetota bacterium]